MGRITLALPSHNSLWLKSSCGSQDVVVVVGRAVLAFDRTRKLPTVSLITGLTVISSRGWPQWPTTTLPSRAYIAHLYTLVWPADLANGTQQSESSSQCNTPEEAYLSDLFHQDYAVFPSVNCAART